LEDEGNYLIPCGTLAASVADEEATNCEG